MDLRTGTAVLGVTSLLAVAIGAPPSAGAPSSAQAPGGPGTEPGYASADKQGFGTARSKASPVWYTLGHGGASSSP